jgi:hypothetical protein
MIIQKRAVEKVCPGISTNFAAPGKYVQVILTDSRLNEEVRILYPSFLFGLCTLLKEHHR